MNKLQGLFELKWLGIPSVPWKRFDRDTHLDPNILWTIRMAVNEGNDVNLPKAVGVTADVAQQKGIDYLEKYGNGFVIFYPFFFANKSGIIEVKEKINIIEAVKDDLWNLTLGGDREVTIFIDKQKNYEIHGNKDFLTPEEIREIQLYAGRVRAKYKDLIFDRSSVMLEWSFAYKSNIHKEPVGERYLVFYECRSLQF